MRWLEYEHQGGRQFHTQAMCVGSVVRREDVWNDVGEGEAED